MGRTLFVGEIIGPDILIVLAIVMVLFGSAKIPKLARSLGQASHEFRKGIGEGATDQVVNSLTKEPSPPAAPAPAGEPTPAEPPKAAELAPPAEVTPPAHPSPTGNSN